jgi:hypothetical protein
MMARNNPTYADTFKYLGMVCDKNINQSNHCGLCGAETLHGWHLQSLKVCTKNVLTNRLHHAHIWLLKTYAIPANMYASQIWSTPFLQQGKEKDNPVQKWLLTVLQRNFGVRDTTLSWCVMRA